MNKNDHKNRHYADKRQSGSSKSPFLYLPTSGNGLKKHGKPAKKSKGEEE